MGLYVDIVAYLLKLRTMESQTLTMQRHINNNKGMVFSARSFLMAEQPMVEYVMPPPSNNCTATEECSYLCGPCEDVIISKTS
jgi:hypothetical protein